MPSSIPTVGIGQGLLPDGLAGALPPGLQGLFAALLGGGSGGPQGDPLAALMAGFQGQGAQPLLPVALDGLNLDTNGLLSLTNQGIVQPPSPLQGESVVNVDIQQLVITIQQTVVQFQQAGVGLEGLGDAADLAAAFVHLGMKPDEAARKATDIETMLKLLKTQLDDDTDTLQTPGDLLSLIAASSTHLTPVVVHVSHTEVTIQHTHVQAQVEPLKPHTKHAKLAAQPSTDLARTLVGAASDATVAATVDASLIQSDALQSLQNTVTDLADKSADILQSSQPVSAELVDTLAQADSGIPVIDSPVLPTGKVSDALTDVERHIPNVTRVGAGDNIGKPQGVEVVRVYDESAKTERKLDALSLRQIGDETPKAPEGVDVRAAVSTQLVARDHHVASGSFAERLAQATRSDVTQQTVVQIRNLVDQGGGTVRMILNPPELGRIQIEITVSGGQVTGSISATDNAVVELLARDVHSLKQSLADVGLKLGNEGLSLMLNTGSQQQNPNQQGQQQAPHAQAGNGIYVGSGDDGSADTTDTTLSPAEWVSPDNLVDVRI